MAVPRYLEVPIFLKSQQVWIITRRRRRRADTATEPPAEKSRSVGRYRRAFRYPPGAGFREHDRGGT